MIGMSLELADSFQQILKSVHFQINLELDIQSKNPQVPTQIKLNFSKLYADLW